MARKKVDTPSTFKTWQDIDAAFGEIIECEGCIDELNVQLNREVALAKQLADEKAKPFYDKIKQLEFAIKDFVVKNRSEFDGKTKQLNFGRTGFRLSTALVVPANKTADILASLKRYNMSDCINIKETVNKDILKKYKSEDILKVGAYLKSTDEFWYEVDKESLKSAEA